MKKDFKQNPVFAFITTPEEPEADPAPIPEAIPKEPAGVPSQGVRSEPPEGQITIFDELEPSEGKTEEQAASRDDPGRGSPGKPEEKRLSEDATAGKNAGIPRKKAKRTAADPPEGYMYTEKKTARLQIVLRPSTCAKVKKAAEAAGLSVNKYIEAAIIEKLERKGKRK